MHRKLVTVITYHYALVMSKTQLDVNVANGVAIDVANDVLPVCWMEVYLFVLANQNHCYIPKLNDLTIARWMPYITRILTKSGRAPQGIM